jgi:hypothetical protein
MKQLYKQEERISIMTNSWPGGAEGYSIPKLKNHIRKEKIKRLLCQLKSVK